MLKYICEAHFGGRAHEIKEYNIAVEAFGRPADFDQTRDSIVRVEAHRLRKRLHEFYTGPGAAHEIHIVLPPGNYVPQFIRSSGAPAAAVAAEPEPHASGEAAPPPTAPRARHPRKLGRYLLAAGSLSLLLVTFFWARTGRHPPMLFSFAAKAPLIKEAIHAPEQEVHILAGSNAAETIDRYGNTWTGDRLYHGGAARGVTPRPIMYTADPAMFHHFRQGDFTYDIPLRKGSYELRLYFADTIFGENNVAGGGETSRVFRIRANGKELLHFLDVVSDAGGSNTADIKVFKDVEPAPDGLLHLSFVTIRNDVPFVNAIEIAPSEPGAIRPIRILAREASYRDRYGRVWSGDRYFHNGILVQRHEPVANTEDEALYQNERFGNFTYSIPVALNSRYTVTMKFCEAWFGADRPGGGGEGTRVFDIFFNGRVLLGNFDVFKEAGSLRALDKSFKGLEPNKQGKLLFTFTPALNYAMVDAIEVVDEAWK